MRSLLSILCLAFLSSSVNGHIYLHSFMSSGQESTSCVRQLPPDSVKQSPIKNVEGPEMMCNVGKSPAKSTCEAKAGDSVTFQFYHNGPTPNDDILDKSHLAPCSVYLSKADASGNPTGWFKIFQKGYNSGSKQWCSDELIAARGKLQVQIPAGLEDGRYVFRTEIIALHEADKSFKEDPNRGAQFYVNCGDINVKGGSGSVRPATIKIPSSQWATFNTPGVKFNVWNKENPNFGSYVVPGPPVLATSTNQPGKPGGSPTKGDNSSSPSNPAGGNGGKSGEKPTKGGNGEAPEKGSNRETGNSKSGNGGQIGGVSGGDKGGQVSGNPKDKKGGQNGGNKGNEGRSGGSGPQENPGNPAKAGKPKPSPARAGQSGGNSPSNGGNSGQAPVCKNGKVTSVGSDGKKWGFENGKSCVVSG